MGHHQHLKSLVKSNIPDKKKGKGLWAMSICGGRGYLLRIIARKKHICLYELESWLVAVLIQLLVVFLF